jgi:hypothetical protein
MLFFHIECHYITQSCEAFAVFSLIDQTALGSLYSPLLSSCLEEAASQFCLKQVYICLSWVFSFLFTAHLTCQHLLKCSCASDPRPLKPLRPYAGGILLHWKFFHHQDGLLGALDSAQSVFCKEFVCSWWELRQG